MTSYRSGYCIICGEYSQSVSIEFPGLCLACADKWDYPKTLKELVTRMQKRIDYLELNR